MRKKIDNRIRVLIENGVAEKHRTMFLVIGDHGRDQVLLLERKIGLCVLHSFLGSNY